MARRTTYSFEKRSKELRKKAKQEAKRERKRLAKAGLLPPEDENFTEGLTAEEAPAAPPGTEFVDPDQAAEPESPAE